MIIKKRHLPLVMLILCQSMCAMAQLRAGYKKEYIALKSGNVLVDKNFYLLTVIEKSNAISKLISSEPFLINLLAKKVNTIQQHATDTCTTPVSLLGEFRISQAESLQLDSVWRLMYKLNAVAFDEIINKHLRPSGYYQRFVDESNADLLIKAWGQCVVGINYILDQYGFGKKMRYPRIDSISYKVNSRYYRVVIKDIMAVLNEKTSGMNLFYHPLLAVALQLMQANDRDEPARHEPLEQKDNKAAYEQVKKTSWQKYKYAAIVLPGNGPELSHTPLSPLNKMRLDFVADRFRRGWASFIIVSGGYCYPYKTSHAEAIEMKNYLMAKHSIDEKFIIVDPHARHTTTNFRNANRLLIRYGFPTDKLSVFVSTKSQIDYVMNLTPTNFNKRNENELGYLPYIGKNRISNHDIEYLPNLLCLHVDPFDPLDP
jgi:hypothetical protein